MVEAALSHTILDELERAYRRGEAAPADGRVGGLLPGNAGRGGGAAAPTPTGLRLSSGAAPAQRGKAVSRVTIANPHGPTALPRMDGRARECLEPATYCRQLAEGERDPEMRAYLLRVGR
jgi:hypothetical protein